MPTFHPHVSPTPAPASGGPAKARDCAGMTEKGSPAGCREIFRLSAKRHNFMVTGIVNASLRLVGPRVFHRAIDLRLLSVIIRPVYGS